MTAEEDTVESLRARKDEAYLERNKVVVALAKLFPSGRNETPGWGEWRHCVYIDLPTGQAWPGLGGPDIETLLVRKNGASAGEIRGSFKLSEADKDLADLAWHFSGNGYLKRQDHLPSPNGYLHRLVAERIWTDIPVGFEVDHIDRDGYNCTRSNLRLATSAGQKLNTSRTATGGVCAKRGRWRAYYGEPYERLGHFDTEGEARTARNGRVAQAIADAHRTGHYIYPPLQISWHFHDDDVALLEGIPPYTKEWDGHDTEDKYRRLADLKPQAPVHVGYRWGNNYGTSDYADIGDLPAGDWAKHRQLEALYTLALPPPGVCSHSTVVAHTDRCVDCGEPARPPSGWFKWTGDYEKQCYDVWVKGCDVVLGCWPNAGFMCTTDGSGRQWSPSEVIAVRVSDFQGRYPTFKE